MQTRTHKIMILPVWLYGLDGNNNTVLFAIHRQNTTIVHKVSGADIALSFVIGLSALPTENTRKSLLIQTQMVARWRCRVNTLLLIIHILNTNVS